MQATTNTSIEADRIPKVTLIHQDEKSASALLSRFDWPAARQRFTAIVAVISLVLALVAVTRTPTDGAGAEEIAEAPAVPVERTRVPAPAEGLFGTWRYRGGEGLTGVSVESGIPAPVGVYWIRQPGGTLRGDPVAHGRVLDVPSTDFDLVYRLELTTGQVVDTLPATGRVSLAAVTGRLTPARGDTPVSTSLYVDEYGTVHGKATEGSATWSIPLGEPVTAGPVIGAGGAVVATRAGRVYGFNADGRTWQFPVEGSVAPISVSPAFLDGVWYVVDDLGAVHLVDQDGNLVCTRLVGLPPIGSPVVEGDSVYVQAIGHLATFPTSGCEGGLRITQSSTDTQVGFAVHDGVAFTVDGHLLFPVRPAVDGVRDLADFEVWNGPYVAGADISTPPVVAGGLVYIGTRAGVVHAVDEATGEAAWTFDANVATGEDVSILGSVVVLDSAVVVTTSGGHVIAIAGGEGG